MFSTQFIGFSICYPVYDDKEMLKVAQHATAPALLNQKAAATFLLLPNWMENSTNAFHRRACATCHSYTSKAKHQKQHGAYAS